MTLDRHLKAHDYPVYEAAIPHMTSQGLLAHNIIKLQICQ